MQTTPVIKLHMNNPPKGQPSSTTNPQSQQQTFQYATTQPVSLNLPQVQAKAKVALGVPLGLAGKPLGLAPTTKLVVKPAVPSGVTSAPVNALKLQPSIELKKQPTKIEVKTNEPQPKKYSLVEQKPAKVAKPKAPEESKEKFVRAAGGQVWEDPTLSDWDTSKTAKTFTLLF